MRCSYSTLVKAKRAGRSTSVRVAPTGTVVEQYQVSLGTRHSLKEAGVIGLPSWSDKATQTETWVKVPRLSATCPRRVVAFDGGRNVAIDRLMEFADEFEGSTLDAAKWTGVGTNAVTAGRVSGTNAGGVASIASFGPNVAAVARAALDAGNYSLVGFSGAVDFARIVYGYPIASKFQASQGGKPTGTEIAYTAGTFAVFEVARNGANNVRYRVNGTQYTTTTQVVQTVMPVKMLAGPGTSYLDYLFIRKCTANEPLTGTAQPSATNRALSRPMSHADLMRACCT